MDPSELKELERFAREEHKKEIEAANQKLEEALKAIKTLQDLFSRKSMDWVVQTKEKVRPPEPQAQPTAPKPIALGVETTSEKFSITDGIRDFLKIRATPFNHKDVLNWIVHQDTPIGEWLRGKSEKEQSKTIRDTLRRMESSKEVITLSVGKGQRPTTYAAFGSQPEEEEFSFHTERRK